ncbi:hypothetical protein B0H34DRAFT_424193 [Crassisporium funariophilum]|nr:hypothetical protein B0H34DRAFT_424193 [Crassisporium funariophilum]
MYRVLIACYSPTAPICSTPRLYDLCFSISRSEIPDGIWYLYDQHWLLGKQLEIAHTIFEMAKLFLLPALLLVIAKAFALPNLQEARDEVYHCGNGVVSPTCCGPLLVDVGGTCRKLKSGEVCIF